jgi:metal-dependent amidase/aminoacylase/carboxypeptidase family protein
MLLACLVALLAAKVRAVETPEAWVESHLDELVELYRDFHRNPELSFQEEETAQRFGEQLEKVGYQVSYNVGGFGVVGVLENGEGPTLMLRTDLDALPVTEQTQLAYASKKRVTNDDGSQVGVMHACGHDIHMTNLVGVSRFLATHRDRWKGTLMVIGQPAEEKGAGAAAMLKDGLFETYPKPDYALALHVDGTLASGHIAYRAGYALANVDSVDVTLYGKGGHGAAPHATIDPVLLAAQLVVNLQSIVAREIKQQLLKGIQRRAHGLAIAAGAPEPKIEISEGTPSLENSGDLVAALDPIFKSVLGEEHVHEAEQVMGGEDFSRYGRAGVPILMYRLGAVESRRLDRFSELGQQPPSLHSPLFYPDAEPALKTGVITMVHAAMHLLESK